MCAILTIIFKHYIAIINSHSPVNGLFKSDILSSIRKSQGSCCFVTPEGQSISCKTGDIVSEQVQLLINLVLCHFLKYKMYLENMSC